jgi:transposase-like protein
MSTTTKKKAVQGIRYTDAQKQEVVNFVLSTNAAQGRGGVSKASTKFKVSPITVNSWLKAAGASAAPKSVTAAPAAKAPAAAAPAAKVAAAPKAAKALKAPKPAKAPKAPKAPKAAKAPKAPKAAKGKVGTRYTPEQKKEVTDFVASYNSANGRGGQSTAAAKFGISPLTVMAWLKASGAPKKAKKGAKKAVKAAKVTKAVTKVAAPKAAAAVASGDIAGKLKSLLDLSQQITKSEAELVSLKAKFASLKASL